MSDLYPLLLKPEFRERIWGTRDLSPLYGPAPGDTPIGEVWLTGDQCQVANGALAGMSLGELCRRFGRDLVGETAPENERFPLLVKFIFPRQKLSVQVHPDDETARRAGLPCGKTECWYVFQAEPGAKIGLGLKPGTKREEFARAIEEVRAEQLLNWIDVRAGELFYVDAGTVHAIGPGVILLETQQNSDTTYRLYDYGRPRELHVQQGLAALKERTKAGKVEPWVTHENLVILVWSRCFNVAKHKVGRNADTSAVILNAPPKGGLPLPAGKTTYRKPTIVVGLVGEGVVEPRDSEPVIARAGEAIVVPACVDECYVWADDHFEFVSIDTPPPDSFHEPAIIGCRSS